MNRHQIDGVAARLDHRLAFVRITVGKFGELFDQSYETMAAGAFRAACDAVDKGFDPQAVETGPVMHDFAQWDNTVVDKPIGPPKNEAGRTAKYV